jgi:hypothetical protein
VSLWVSLWCTDDRDCTFARWCMWACVLFSIRDAFVLTIFFFYVDWDESGMVRFVVNCDRVCYWGGWKGWTNPSTYRFQFCFAMLIAYNLDKNSIVS